MTPVQALNIMESDPLSNDGDEPEYSLEKWGLYEEKPNRFVGRRSRFGKEFGCYWPSDMAFQGAEYESQSAYCKSEQVWEMVLVDDRVQNWFDGYAKLPLFNQDTNLTFDYVSDQMPEGRYKIVHPRGVVTRVRWESTGNHPYTGMFASGAKYGIMRQSEVDRVDPEVLNTSSPGFGLKLFRDYMPSANILSMYSHRGQDSFNYYHEPWTTHLAEPQNICGRLTLNAKFAEGSRHLGNTSVMEVAEFDEYGNPVACPVWPFQLLFEPTLGRAFPNEWVEDF